MVIRSRMNDNWNKVNTKEELIELLKWYKGILSYSMVCYLNSLVNLEFSVIRDYIDENDRMALSELEVYKRIAIYNIYNRALQLFEESKSKLEISGNNNGFEHLLVTTLLGGRDCTLFRFNYGVEIDEFNKNKIGDILLYKKIKNNEKREEELMRIISELKRLNDKENPYHSIHRGRRTNYGGPALSWEVEKNRKISALKEEYNLLRSKKELSDEDKKEIEITQKFHELLLKDYGLKNIDFEEDNSDQILIIDKKENKKTEKILVKRMPNINIIDKIKYI